MLLAFFILRLDRYISFSTLKEHRAVLLAWTKAHYIEVVIVYMILYTVAVAVSIPGSVFFTLTGGFLFGIGWGLLYVVISATLGAVLLFFAVRLALSDWFKRKTSAWIVKMRKGFNKNAFQYLLVLRLIPLFPFWIVNIVPALLGVKTKTFVSATLIGITPGALVYVMLGNGLGHIFDTDKTLDLSLIFEPQVLLPLLGLASLSFLSILYKRIKDKAHE